MVNGCLRAVDDKNAEKANDFVLENAHSARSLTLGAPPAAVTAFKVVGLVPDLRRHAGDDVEIIGTVVEDMPVGPSATLEVKSIYTRTEGCAK
jgi:hypothetical protein